MHLLPLLLQLLHIFFTNSAPCAIWWDQWKNSYRCKILHIKHIQSYNWIKLQQQQQRFFSVGWFIWSVLFSTIFFSLRFFLMCFFSRVCSVIRFRRTTIWMAFECFVNTHRYDYSPDMYVCEFEILSVIFSFSSVEFDFVIYISIFIFFPLLRSHRIRRTRVHARLCLEMGIEIN